MAPLSAVATIIILLLNHSVKCDYFELPFYDCTVAKTNYELGYCIGENTINQTKSRWSQWTEVQNLYNWITTTQNGSDIYQQFLSNNAAMFPLYMDEAHGIADGSGFDFDKIFIMTCADEISYFAPPGLAYEPSLACSDYLMTQYKQNKMENSFMTHNEDNRSPNINNTYLVKSNVSNEIAFFAYGYAGEVLTQSSGWNDYVIFTSNFVHPNNPVQAGLCRNFVARQMLVQKSLQDTLDKSAMNGQCSGHNYQIGEFVSGKTSDSEVAYDAIHAFTDITSQYEWTFHANMYIHLNISQPMSQSSTARENTANTLGRPQDIDDMLDFLGDHSNASYPIYKSGQENDYTLHSTSVDLLAGTVDLLADNPKYRNVLYRCSVDRGGKTGTPTICK